MSLPNNPAPLFYALDRVVLSLEKIKELIEKYPSYINKKDVDLLETPLIKILKNETCSIDIVQLMLQHDAEVNPDGNCRHYHNPCALSTALRHSRGKDIIRALLEAGADVNFIDNTRQSPLCVALENNSSKDIVELLLQAKCDLKACLVHNTVLQCATDSVRYNGLNEDILNLLIEAGANINKPDCDGRSNLCYAFGRRAKVDDIKLMIKLDASLYDCKMHQDPILCAVEPGYSRCPTLKMKMVMFLCCEADVRIDKVDGGFYRPIKYALWNSTYDTEAIELLLDISGMGADAVSEENETLLHFALHNHFYYNISTIKMILDRGVPVNVVDSSGDTPLHIAIKNNHISASVIKILLMYDADVDAKDINGNTPLRLAILHQRDTMVIKELLLVGAGLDETQTDCKLDGLFKVLLERYTHWTPRACIATSELLVLTRTNPDAAEFLRKASAYPFIADLNLVNETFRDRPGIPVVTLLHFQRHQEVLEDIRMFLKLFILLDPEFDFENIIEVYRGCEIFIDFVDDCLRELTRMESASVGYSRSLRRFVESLSGPNNYDFEELMNVIDGNDFPIYLDIILDRAGRSTLKMKAQEWMYTVRYSPDLDLEKTSSVLDYHSFCSVAKFLFDKDLLRLLLACF